MGLLACKEKRMTILATAKMIYKIYSSGAAFVNRICVPAKEK